MLLLPSSVPCVSVVWGCLVYCCSVTRYADLVIGMLCPPSSQVMQPPPPPLRALAPGLLVGWLMVFGLLDWLLGSLVGCWCMGFVTAEFGWLVGWLHGCMVRCLLGSCWGVCTRDVGL